MQIQIFSDQPWWFWGLCLAGGLAFAVGLYWRERKMQAAAPNIWLRRLLFAFRSVVATALLMLLLDPYIKRSSNETEKPVVIMLQDNSSSLANGLKDTAAYAKQWQQLRAALADDYDVRVYPFGEQLQDENAALTFKAPSTNISAALESVNNLYENMHVAGVILASDGIYNSGGNPVYVKNALSAPIYTLALGDTARKKDVRILRTLHNNIVYLRDRFSIQSDIEAIFCAGSAIQISIAEITPDGTRNLGTQRLMAEGEQFGGQVTWELTADAPGIRHYRIQAAKVEGEFTTANNTQDIYIEVLDARQKILILTNAPHPDINALRLAMEKNVNYAVEVQLAAEWKGSAADYDLIVLHQLPSASYPIAALLNDIRTKEIPVWFITGSQTDLRAFNNAQSLITINGSGQSANEVTALMESQFNLFTADDKMLSTIPQFPALVAPYGQYTASPASQVLAYQKIGAVATKTPLFIFSLPGGEKTAVLCGENIWRWRLYDFIMNKDQTATDGLIGKTVQYLAVKNDKKPFRVSQSRQVYNETERIVLDAELYNDSYELINTPDATITITDEQGKDFPFQFSKTGKSYTLNAGYFPAGSYTFKAQTNFNGKSYTDAGAFSVLPVRLETINTTADHRLLNQIATQTGGEMAVEQNMHSLADTIRKSAVAKPVMRQVTRTQSVINLQWIFAILLVLLGVEWFMRKYVGGY